MNFTSRFNTQKSKADILDEKQKVRIHGKEMWNVLHTFSVFFPENPSEEDINTYTSFVNGVLLFGTKFDSNWSNLTKNYIQENPYKFNSREDSMIWMCNFHNYVNVQLEKDLFECTKENIAKRWGNIGSIISKGNVEKNFTI